MVIVKVLMGDYKEVELPVEDAVKLLEKAMENRGMTRDISESLRILKNFDEFYRVQQKRGRAYLTPPKEMRDMLYGKAFVDKIKLVSGVGGKRAVVMFDRRVGIDEIKEYLGRIGYKEIKIVD